MNQRTIHIRWVAAASVALLLLAGCASEPADPGTAKAPEAAADSSGKDPATDESADESADNPATEPAATGPREQAEDCGWNDAALTAAPPALPTGEDGDLDTVIIGAWQHTHFDTGTGFEPVDNDIRYIFPSTERILYCQHVAGVTDYAENAAPITWDGTQIVLPGSAPGYVVSEWNDSTMVWINLRDDSRYLLQRR